MKIIFFNHTLVEENKKSSMTQTVKKEQIQQQNMKTKHLSDNHSLTFYSFQISSSFAESSFI